VLLAGKNFGESERQWSARHAVWTTQGLINDFLRLLLLHEKMRLFWGMEIL
jgi:hypothetical protein